MIQAQPPFLIHTQEETTRLCSQGDLLPHVLLPSQPQLPIVEYKLTGLLTGLLKFVQTKRWSQI